MSDTNLILLSGNLTRDLELRYTQKGTAVLSGSIAANRNYKKDNEWRQETAFVDFQAWDRVAERMVKSCANKGQKIFLEGRIKQDEWIDKQTDQKRTKTVILVNDFHAVQLPPKQESYDHQQSTAGAVQQKDWNSNETEDDIPF